MKTVDIMQTKIQIGGVLRCCLSTVAVEFVEKGKVDIGQTSKCEHCKQEFILTETGIEETRPKFSDNNFYMWIPVK